MPFVRQSSFGGGEVAPTLYGRADLQKYASALKRQRNAITLKHGAVQNRPGTTFCGEVKNSGVARLLRFSFSDGQNFVLEFGEQYIRFYWNGAIVTSGGLPYEVVTPYTVASDLFKIKYAQHGDIITLVHPSFAPYELKRNSNTDWDLDLAIVVRPSAPTSLSFAAPATEPWSTDKQYGLGTWVSKDDGGTKLFLSIVDNNKGKDPLSETDFWLRGGAYHPDLAAANHGLYYETALHGGVPGRPAKEWEWVVTAVSTAGVESLPSAVLSPSSENPYAISELVNKVVLAADFPVTIVWTFAGDQIYRVYRGRNGVYGFVGEVKGQPQFQDDGQAPDYGDTPPTGETPFVGAGNFPSAVAFFQQRRWFGGTINNPFMLRGTRTGEYYNFDVAQIAKDDDAVKFALATQKLEKIRNLLGLRVLLALTSESEWNVMGPQGGTITPSAVEAHPQSYVGSADIMPLAVGNVALYVQATGAQIRELFYQQESDSYGGSDITLLASHLFEGRTVVDWTHAPLPHSILWVVMSDGALLGCSYLREQELVAWHRHDTDGVVESICSVQESTEHAVYMIVRRTIGGNARRYIERFASRVEGVVFLDSALRYSGAAATSFSGLGHLEGKAVMVVGDGAVYGPYTVNGGAVSIATECPDGAASVVVGLPYTTQIESLPVFSYDDHSVHTRLKALYRAWLEVLNTRGLMVGPSFAKLKEWRSRDVSDDYGTPVANTGLISIATTSRFDRESCIAIEHSDPLPLTLLSVIREVSVESD